MAELFDNIDSQLPSVAVDTNLNFSSNADNYLNQPDQKWGNINNLNYSNNEVPPAGSPTGISWSTGALQPSTLCFASGSGVWASGNGLCFRYSTDGLATVLQAINITGSPSSPSGITEVSTSELAVSDLNSANWRLYSLSTGLFMGNRAIGATTNGGSEFRDNTQVIAETATNTIKIYIGASTVASITKDVTPEMSGPSEAFGSCKLSNGYVILDKTAKTIFKYDLSMNYTGVFYDLSSDVAGGTFDICSDSNDFIYIGDRTNNIIYQLTTM